MRLAEETICPVPRQKRLGNHRPLFHLLVPFNTVIIPLPDIRVLLPPARHQIRAHRDISAALIAGNIMASTDIEEPGLMAVNTTDIPEKSPHIEVAPDICR